MILNSTPQNEAVLSNVGEIGEFRIRNSAKAFSILSSGLYANKVRAIIRELSCNATDSHVAANNLNTPFDVHLPNALEPFFSIRDYGTGLNHDQVTSIYTTYFESTKTGSNDFIGALGLGSKSPFSYTDNFTVTAIKDGRKGIYTAFINEQGVPSIALMMEEDTTEPSGVEVRFAVEDRYDFNKFRDEARQVYKYFKQRPVISGSAGFEFSEPVYKDKDIIPGVHTNESYNSVAIMGNIAYPIDVPSADNTIPADFKRMLSCGLVMEFSIGELDFQASREGLSYIPQTIESIKRKLEALNAQLSVHIATEADKIDNMWERALYLATRKNDELWTAAVNKYVTDTKFPLIAANGNRWDYLHTFKLDTNELVTKYNIVIRAFAKSKHQVATSSLNARPDHRKEMINGVQQTVTYNEWHIRVGDDMYFVFNDTKIGALERAKYHWRKNKFEHYQSNVYVIEAADKTKPVDKAAFLADLMNPPAGQIKMASELDEKERAKGMGSNVTIMRLEESRRGSWGSSVEMVWRDAGKADQFDDTTTFYYLPLSGYKNLGEVSDVKSLSYHLGKSKIHKGHVYGVRKADIEWVKTKKNWVNLDEFAKDKLAKLSQADVMGLVKQNIDWKDLYQYNATKSVTNPASPYLKLFNEFKDVKEVDSYQQTSLRWLCGQYQVATASNIEPTALIDKYTKEVESVFARYPLLRSISRYSINSDDVAEYINLIDEKKGV